ncbi:syntaxin-binding protein 1-like [Dendronephthya gigantea]|uniref:syntaxin-binding protein 1-like n=1 Tax=Dendronephthya gigantea TaxID=151771 RepID=UPI001068E952|nr:syntaxin-binding protein 1-like [Dendronephthya gigantea]
MSLKEAVGKRIIEEVIKPLHEPKKWKVLILDNLSLRIVSSCCKMSDIMSEGITIVEGLKKSREPLPALEAIYILTPIAESIDLLMNDFREDEQVKYPAAHVFFTEVCNDELISKLANSYTAKFIKTMKEINMAFIPYESQVFSLDTPQVVNTFYLESEQHIADIEKVAEQLATLCSTLGEYPSIRFRATCPGLGELAHALQNRLTAYKAEDPSMGEGSQKHRSQFLLLDRGFDPVAPLLHELTFQAMAYDLLDIKNDVFTFMSGDDEKSVVLDESDKLWVELRHKHIADVSTKVPEKVKKFATSNKLSKAGDKADMRDLKQMLKRLPQYQKEMSGLNVHFMLTEECMKKYKKTAEKICPVEQDLATGVDNLGEKIKDPLKNINPLLLDSGVSVADKIRIILLYIIAKDGISEENLLKLCQHAQIPYREQQIIHNMANIGVLIKEGNMKKKSKPERKERPPETYQLSRYVPFVKDLMEDSLLEKLNEKMFNYIPVARGSVSSGYSSGVGKSARYGQWHKGQQNTRSCPRLIVFIMGGVTYSEMRTAYEVKAANKDWDIIIGSTHLIRPEDFLSMLQTLSA